MKFAQYRKIESALWKIDQREKRGQLSASDAVQARRAAVDPYRKSARTARSPRAPFNDILLWDIEDRCVCGSPLTPAIYDPQYGKPNGADCSTPRSEFHRAEAAAERAARRFEHNRDWDSDSPLGDR